MKHFKSKGVIMNQNFFKCGVLVTSLFFSLSSYANRDSSDRGSIDSGQFNYKNGQRRGNESSIYPRGANINTPTYAGNGCRQGTVSALLSSDKKTLSVLFDEYTSSVGRNSGVTRDSKKCNIVIPFVIPRGYQVAVVRLDYRGYNYLARGSRSRFISGYFFREGNRDQPVTHSIQRQMRFDGPLDQDFQITSPMTLRGRNLWSKCGKTMSLNITTSMLTVANEYMDNSESTVDSLDMSSNYHLLWRSCRERRERPGRLGRDHRRRRGDRDARDHRRHRHSRHSSSDDGPIRFIGSSHNR